jgi:glycosyltransferase involved in cell wall biosynthesis
MSRTPLVTIGIPTYNRAATLVHAVESALAQDWSPLEVVISDNASSDETQAYCEDLQRRDERVVYVRQPANIGAEANFSHVLRHASGELFMWLADDDRLDPTYVSACARVLIEQPDHALVCGRAHYYREGELAFAERPVNLTSSSPRARLLGYYGSVTLNGSFYGVTRRAQVAALPFPRIDWLLVASLAYLGKVRTLDETALHRSIEGASQDSSSLGRRLGLTRRQERNWHLVVARAARDDIRRAAVYRPLRRYERLVLGSSAWLLVVTRFSTKVWLARVLERAGLFGRARAALERRRRRRG